MSKVIQIDMKVSQDPVKGPSIVLMHMMAVKGKQWLPAHGTAVCCTQTNGLWGNKECLFSVLQKWSKVQQEQTKKANTHTQTQTEDLCQMKTNDGKGNHVSNRALQSSSEHTSLSAIVSTISLPIPTRCSYMSIQTGWTFPLSMETELKIALKLNHIFVRGKFTTTTIWIYSKFVLSWSMQWYDTFIFVFFYV